MALNWPGIQNHGSDLDSEDERELKSLLDEFGDAVAERLHALGLSEPSSPLWRAWNLYTMTDAERVVAVFTQLSGGIANVRHLSRRDELIPPDALAAIVQRDTGQVPIAVVVLPKPEASDRAERVGAAADRHVADVEREMRLGRLGDLTGVQHLEPYLRTFLDDHPEPSRNVFVMMRFFDSKQLNEVFHHCSPR